MREYNKTHKKTPEQKRKKSEYMKKWAIKNKESLSKYQKERWIRDKDDISLKKKDHYKKHIKEIKVKKHKYYLKNRERFSEKGKKYALKNKEAIREYKKNYAKTYKGKYFSYSHSARSRGYIFSLTEEQFKILLDKNCHYCNKPKAYGIDRINSDIGYKKGNILPCCSICNYMKKSSSYTDFLNHIKNIAEHLNIIK